MKQFFYTVCFMAVAFYLARIVRAVALYWEARARKVSRE